MFATINNRLGLAIADSGAYKSEMDLCMAQAYGLHVCHTVNSNCGRHAVPSSGIKHDYAGVVEQSFNMRLGEHMSSTLTGMRIIDHTFALFLLGADIMCGRRQAPSWKYMGIGILVGNDSTVFGSVSFSNGARSESSPLAKST